ncbi:MAG: hypothetical protein CMN00_06140 [Rickettsiales bacterium]|nr:hypothetical protein [Rickettsiales bacterium]|tara:strand:+ start:2681 stop:3688 length:1008 start_codon:yes stop_codon:yes gene_type:complete
MKNKKILIFGATGQIGKELSLELNTNNYLDLMSHSRTKVGASFFKHNKINSLIGNLPEENITKEISKADLIIDLAAPYDGTLQENKNFYKERIDIFFNNMKKNTKFIFASSMNAFGIDSKRNVLKNYLISSSIYASNKRYAEKYIKKLGVQNNRETFVIRLSEVHGNYQRASEKIKKLISHRYVFEIPDSPAWITFITLFKEVIINILEGKEKPGEYTLVCDDIYWSDLLNYLGRDINMSPKYEIIKKNKDNFTNRIKKITQNYLISKKDLIRGNLNVNKDLEDLMKLDFRIQKAKEEFRLIDKAKIYSEYNRYSGTLPGKRFESLKYDKKLLLK